MTKVYLFDWGDTLMVDFPQYQGAMCRWPELKAEPGALEVLSALSAHHPIYVATNADNSSVKEIKQAFSKVGLARYISGYFCKKNMGVAKGCAEYFHRIVLELDVEPHNVTMVGDSMDKDILPAIAAGLNAIWYQPQQVPQQAGDKPYRQICTLEELTV